MTGGLDFSRAHRFEKPIFGIAAEPYPDGGSGQFSGIGYAFEISNTLCHKMNEQELQTIVVMD